MADVNVTLRYMYGLVKKTLPANSEVCHYIRYYLQLKLSYHTQIYTTEKLFTKMMNTTIGRYKGVLCSLPTMHCA